MIARLLFRKCRPKRPLVGERCVCIRNMQNARSQRNLFKAQAVGITAAVPPFMMPAHQQLRDSIGACISSFVISQHWMACELCALLVTVQPIAMNVIARHRRFTEIVCERRDSQRQTIARSQVKRLSNFVGDRGDAGRVRMRIALEMIGFRGEISENLDRSKVLIDSFYWWHAKNYKLSFQTCE